MPGPREPLMNGMSWAYEGPPGLRSRVWEHGLPGASLLPEAGGN